MHDATPLDRAHAAMAAAPEDDAARLAYYAALADTELVLWLAAEPVGDDPAPRIAPRVFDLDDGPVVLAFDSADRLGAAATQPVPYAALPGRVVAQALAGQGVALGVNLGVAPSAFLVSPDALDWLAATLSGGPARTEARPVSFHAPGRLPAGLIGALTARLSETPVMAAAALVAGVAYADGRRGHLLAIVGAETDAEAALARAVSEALIFSGVEAGEIDVTFLAPDDAALPALARVAQPLDLPPPRIPDPVQAPRVPGPPRLR